MVTFRDAHAEDIPQMQVVRNAVKENQLSDPGLIQDAHYLPYLDKRGKGWVCEEENTVVGFAIADLEKNNIWALFVDPSFENKGIGKLLHALMLNWFFSKTNELVWLGTAPNSRAAKFYVLQGWSHAGTTKDGELKFEMTAEHWAKPRSLDKQNALPQ